MNKKELLALALLYVDSSREIEGVTRLQKLVFLTQEKAGLKIFNFKPYKYGPYSRPLYDTLDKLEKEGFIESTARRTRNDNEKHIYSITGKGQAAIKKFLEESDVEGFMETADRVKHRFNGKPLRELLQYVYHSYPEYAENSKLDL